MYRLTCPMFLACVWATLAWVSCPRARDDTPYSNHPEPANTHSYVTYADDHYALAVGTAERWDDGFLCIHDLEDGRIVWHDRWPDRIDGLTVSPSGDRIAIGDASGRVAIWRVQRDGTLTKQSECQLDDAVKSLCWPTETQLAAGTRSGAILVLHADPLEKRAKLDGHSDWVISLTCSPDGRRVASGGRDDRLIVWETKKWSRVHEFSAGQWPREILWSGDWLVAVYSHKWRKKAVKPGAPTTPPARLPEIPGRLEAWKTDTWEQTFEHKLEDDGLLYAAFHSDSGLTIFDTGSRRAKRRPRLVSIELSNNETRRLLSRTVPYGGVYYADGSRLLGRWGCHGLVAYQVSDGELAEIWLQGRE